MITRLSRQCPVCVSPVLFTLAIEESERGIEDCRVENVECEHRIVFERIAEDDDALRDMLNDARPYDGPMYSGEGGGDPREAPSYVNAMRDAGRMR